MKLFYFLALAGSAMALPAVYYNQEVLEGEYDGDDGCEEAVVTEAPVPETVEVYETYPEEPPCYDENGNLIDENELDSYDVVEEDFNPLEAQ